MSVFTAKQNVVYKRCQNNVPANALRNFDH